MIKEILNNLEKNNKLPIIKHEGQWLLGTKKIIIMHTEPINKYTDGSLNGLKLQGIGKYTIPFEESSCIYVFTFLNDSRIQHEYVIIPQPELLKRLHSQNHIERCNNIRFWLTENSKLIESYGYGAEGEFMALWLNENRDFTEFLNNWTVKD